jgi:hypothetical protein
LPWRARSPAAARAAPDAGPHDSPEPDTFDAGVQACADANNTAVMIPRMVGARLGAARSGLKQTRNQAADARPAS